MIEEKHSVDAVLSPGNTVLLINQPVSYVPGPRPPWWKRMLGFRAPLIAVNINGVWEIQSNGVWTKPR